MIEIKCDRCNNSIQTFKTSDLQTITSGKLLLLWDESGAFQNHRKLALLCDLCFDAFNDFLIGE